MMGVLVKLEGQEDASSGRGINGDISWAYETVNEWREMEKYCKGIGGCNRESGAPSKDRGREVADGPCPDNHASQHLL